MISFSKTAATVLLPRSAYDRASIEAAALVVGDWVETRLSARGRFFSVELRTPGGRAALERVVGVFLDEALAHAARRRVAREGAPFADAALARAFERGFAAVPADPLEQLEPQVAEDRRGEIARLLDEAGR
jgi:hypothetical protein